MEQSLSNLPPVVTSDQGSVTTSYGQTAANTGTWNNPNGGLVTLTASLGTVTENANGTWSWSYAAGPGSIGSHTVTVTATDANELQSTTSFTLTVTPAPLQATGVNISATAGAPFSGIVATFTNADPFGNAASYTATITWEDGSQSAGVISGSGTLTVTGSHTFADPGSNEAFSVQMS